MADAPAPNFTARAARRIARTVRTAERRPFSLEGEPNPPPLATQTFVMARLLTKPAAGKYTWQEVRRKHDGTWVEKVGGRKAETADAAVAVPPTGSGDTGGVYPTGVSTEPVMLRRTPVEQADGTFALRWVIVTGGRIVTVQCTDDHGHAGTTVAAKVWNGSAVEGDPFEVTIVGHTTTGDVFDAVAGSGRYVQLGHPVKRKKFMVLMDMDGPSGGPQGIDWDFLKGVEPEDLP